MCQKPRFGTPRRFLAESPRGDSLRNHLAETPQGRYRRETHRGEAFRIFLGAMPRRASGVFYKGCMPKGRVPREEILRGEIPKGRVPKESFPENPSQGVFPWEEFPWEEFPLGRIPCVLSPRFCPWTGCSSDKNGRSFLLYWEGAKGGGGFGHLCG